MLVCPSLLGDTRSSQTTWGGAGSLLVRLPYSITGST